jgi:hypothetical protein
VLGDILMRIGRINGIFARCLWERTPGAPPHLDAASHLGAAFSLLVPPC